MKHSFSWEVRTCYLSFIISEAVTHSLNLFTESPMLVSLFCSYLPPLPFLPGSIISYFPLVLSRLVFSCLVRCGGELEVEGKKKDWNGIERMGGWESLSWIGRELRREEQGKGESRWKYQRKRQIGIIKLSNKYFKVLRWGETDSSGHRTSHSP